MTPENAKKIRDNAYREDIEQYVKDMLPLYDDRFSYAKAHLLTDMKQAWEIHESLTPIKFQYHRDRAEIWKKRYEYLITLEG